ncbi:MAG: rod shape-determining protein RodA [Patescibacteria group bacterium]|nr:rod shape-determining protein RodA [Patescibacteria group bacterium]
MRSLKIDSWLLGSVLFLMAASLVTLSSIDQTLFIRQIVWVAIAIVVMLILPYLNLRAIFSYRWVILAIYLGSLSLLLLTDVVARSIRGHHSWIILGPILLQPSEFMKAALIILLSSFFAIRHVSIARWKTIAASFLYFVVPFILVLLQGDTGTALVLFAIWFGYLLISEIPWKYLLAFFLVFVVVGAAAWNFGLANYQKQRIIGLFSPSYDPLGINYNVIQSKIAIGSGGLFGEGLGQATQVQLGFLPAASTDFIFSAFTEEWGVIGSLVLIGAFMLLIYRIVKVGLATDNNFSRFICLGTVIFILAHLIINIGSNMGFLPVIGIGLPLVSYGGSNLLTVATLVGIIQNIAKRASF